MCITICDLSSQFMLPQEARPTIVYIIEKVILVKFSLL